MADGLTVVGLDVDAAGLAEVRGAHGAAFEPMRVDLLDPPAIAAAFAGIGDRHGGLDALVNNAGTCLMSDFPEIPAEELSRQMALNFEGAFHCCQAAVPLMAGRAGVRKIVNISSNGAYNFDVFDPPHYRASKAALDTLTKDLARRYARDKIAVNSIAPAMTETPLFKVLSRRCSPAPSPPCRTGRRCARVRSRPGWASWSRRRGDISSGNVIILNQGRDVR